MRTPLDECLRKFVVIEADGIRYMGTLIEVGEEEAILKSEARWIGVPIERIASIREVDPAKVLNPEIEEVDADEYLPVDSEALPVDAPESAGEDPEEEGEDDGDCAPPTDK